MHRTIVSLAFLALIAPSMAANQVPSSSAHPASSAHANAMAGAAGAARLEACAKASRNFLDQLAKGDFKTAVNNFDATLQSQVGSEKLGEAWQSLGARFGKFESLGTSQEVMYQGTPVVTTPLHFAHGDLAAQLACDPQGKFAGFHLLPMPSSAAASAASSR